MRLPKDRYIDRDRSIRCGVDILVTILYLSTACVDLPDAKVSALDMTGGQGTRPPGYH